MNNRRQGRGKSRLLTQTSYIYDGKVKNPAVKVLTQATFQVLARRKNIMFRFVLIKRYQK
ncbi:MAG: hypothetical protein ACLRM4_04185 [Anaerostipes sp.]